MSSVPDSSQKFIIDGQLLISTDLNTNVQEKGQIAFVDRLDVTRVLAGMRIFGTPQSRLIVDAYNSANGLAFRSNKDQGIIPEGGLGYSYAFEVLTNSNRSGVVLNVVEQNQFQNPNTEVGDTYFTVTRSGTSRVPFTIPSTRYVSRFFQNTYKTGEEIYIGVGGGQGVAVLGYNNSASQSFLCHSTSQYNEPIKTLVWSDTGLVSVPQNLFVYNKFEAGSKVAVFNRANTNYMQLPASKLTFTTNMSFLAAVKFTGTAGNNERVFEFATASNENNTFYISRSGTTATLRCAANNATTQVGLIDGVGLITQDQWTVISATYVASTSQITLYQDGINIGSVTCSAPLTDKTTSSSQSFFGRSTVTANSYTSYSIGGFYVYDQALSGSQISAVTLSNYTVLPMTYKPVQSFLGSRLSFQNGETISNWDGASQFTTARRPITEVIGLQYSSSGLSVQGNISGTNIVGTLTTAAQPNITSLGTLSSLDVTGTVTATNLSGTLTTASQPNVTSVGTLTILNVTGTITGDSLSLQSISNTPTSNVLYYDTTTKNVSYGISPVTSLLPITLDTVNNRVGINKTDPTTALDVTGTVTATNLAGTLTTAAQPNVTSVGTLTSLNVTGTATATNLAGTLTTAAQPNVTSVGTLTSLNVTGTATATNLAGTLTTAAQPNVTSLGTLTSLDVTGTVSGGNVNSTGVYRIGGVDFVASRNTNAVAVGPNAGNSTPGTNTVAVGVQAGRYSQGNSAVAIGNSAGGGTTTAGTGQGNNAVAIGNVAGNNTQGASAVAIGFEAGTASQKDGAISIGQGAGKTSQGIQATAVGRYAGLSNQGDNSVAVGINAGVYGQGNNAVAIGPNTATGTTTAGTGQGSNAVAVGASAGNTTQGSSAVAVGPNAGQTSQGGNAVAIGYLGGQTSQGSNSVAIGINCANDTQGSNSVAVGVNSGRYTQGVNSVAIGNSAGSGTSTAGTGQGASAVAIGQQAGQSTQGSQTVAIGIGAGQTSQGSNAIAIGSLAGQTGQHASSIILNASGVALNSDGTSRFYVKPVRTTASETNFLAYNATTSEVTYTNTFSSLTVTNLAGTLITASQPNITTLGTLTSLNVTGTVTAANLAGTLTTASQPNITTLGTLTSLSVTGAASTGTMSLQSIANTTTSNVLYYDTTTKAVTYGAASSTPTPTTVSTYNTNDFGMVAGENASRPIQNVSLTLNSGVYHVKMVGRFDGGGEATHVWLWANFTNAQNQTIPTMNQNFPFDGRVQPTNSTNRDFCMQSSCIMTLSATTTLYLNGAFVQAGNTFQKIWLAGQCGLIATKLA